MSHDSPTASVLSPERSALWEQEVIEKVELRSDFPQSQSGQLNLIESCTGIFSCAALARLGSLLHFEISRGDAQYFLLSLPPTPSIAGRAHPHSESNRPAVADSQLHVAKCCSQLRFRPPLQQLGRPAPENPCDHRKHVNLFEWKKMSCLLEHSAARRSTLRSETRSRSSSAVFAAAPPQSFARVQALHRRT